MTGVLAEDFFGVITVLEGVLMIVLIGLFLGVVGVFGGFGLVGVDATPVDFFDLRGVRGDAFTGAPP